MAVEHQPFSTPVKAGKPKFGGVYHTSGSAHNGVSRCAQECNRFSPTSRPPFGILQNLGIVMLQVTHALIIVLLQKGLRPHAAARRHL